ncbi:hypothetical protein BC828DRAFT_390386 [Blastocladiella britannica]|nr:hypothetical protein BC828DRAFT_390386 [Blastocladiella britannica]
MPSSESEPAPFTADGARNSLVAFGLALIADGYAFFLIFPKFWSKGNRRRPGLHSWLLLYLAVAVAADACSNILLISSVMAYGSGNFVAWRIIYLLTFTDYGAIASIAVTYRCSLIMDNIKLRRRLLGVVITYNVLVMTCYWIVGAFNLRWNAANSISPSAWMQQNFMPMILLLPLIVQPLLLLGACVWTLYVAFKRPARLVHALRRGSDGIVISNHSSPHEGSGRAAAEHETASGLSQGTRASLSNPGQPNHHTQAHLAHHAPPASAAAVETVHLNTSLEGPITAAFIRLTFCLMATWALFIGSSMITGDWIRPSSLGCLCGSFGVIAEASFDRVLKSAISRARAARKKAHLRRAESQPRESDSTPKAAAVVAPPKTIRS